MRLLFCSPSGIAGAPINLWQRLGSDLAEWVLTCNLELMGKHTWSLAGQVEDFLTSKPLSLFKFCLRDDVAAKQGGNPFLVYLNMS